MSRICLIKLGALGDVLRTTPILHPLVKEGEITWVTLDEAIPLLQEIPHITCLLPLSRAQELKNEPFDLLLNADEDPRACMLAEALQANTKKGYGWRNGTYVPFDKDAEYAYRLSHDDVLKFHVNRKTYQQILFEMTGMCWKGEDYLLGFRPAALETDAIGLNYLVGEKFQTKHWPHWKVLEDNPGVSVQQMYPSLNDYVDWIQSCRILVTSDSLGMHIALALRKRVVILMGSTSWREIETYGRAIKIVALARCAPCYKKTCPQSFYCMDWISPKLVNSAVERLLSSHRMPVDETWYVAEPAEVRSQPYSCPSQCVLP